MRDDLATARTVETSPVEPADGEVAFAVDSFALTANNVTYGAVGDLVGYWNFYPASEDGWGRIPVWGFADVTASRVDGVEVGDRYFGYWPMSSDAVLRPGSVGPGGFTDVTPHRVDLPAIYNRYARTPRDGDPHAEALTSLLRPLFATSFLIDAWLADEALFGADAVVLSSASSKTALGLAHLLSANDRATVVGLTSRGHVDFVAATGCYDRVVGYDDLPDGLGDAPAVYVDFAGSAAVLGAVHRHFGDRLRRSVTVGFTHRAPGDNAGLPGPAPEFFFAPDHIARRTQEWGGDGVAERLDAARAGFDAAAGTAIEVVERHGADAVVDTWTAAVDGALDPSLGVICRWHERDR